jgi:hypothetical protein
MVWLVLEFEGTRRIELNGQLWVSDTFCEGKGLPNHLLKVEW